MIDVATAVESYVHDALQLALEFDGSDAVQQLWVYAGIDDDRDRRRGVLPGGGRGGHLGRHLQR